jgi:hypothetical protein
MQMTQPLAHIEFTKQRVNRYKDDVQRWEQGHSELASDCWAWEDFIDDANRLFARLLKLDVQVQRYVLLDRGDDAGMQDKLIAAVSEWLSASLQVLPQAERLESEYGRIAGADELKRNVKAAKAMLTPDDEFFSPETLSRYSDDAIEAHRAGLTEPLLDNERVQ